MLLASTDESFLLSRVGRTSNTVEDEAVDWSVWVRFMDSPRGGNAAACGLLYRTGEDDAGGVGTWFRVLTGESPYAPRMSSRPESFVSERCIPLPGRC